MNNVMKENAELMNLLRQKDEEIAEYKACGTINPSRSKFFFFSFFQREKCYFGQHSTIRTITYYFNSVHSGLNKIA